MLTPRAKIRPTADASSPASWVSLTLLNCNHFPSPVISLDSQAAQNEAKDLLLSTPCAQMQNGLADSLVVWSSKTVVRFDELQGVKFRSCFRATKGSRKSVRSVDCAVLRVGDWTAGIRKQHVNVARHIDGFIRRNCSRVPLGWACLSQEEYAHGKKEDASGAGEGGGANAFEDKQKRVLILMSDTGGGHRASAEAIKATFALEYGDEYSVSALSVHHLYR
ncbi:hypothetical protein O6H91_19G007900 [Diphasiastrum complanatum]|uniref:Uncharacterized protein n=1 Tax=Diphasiastrum complanatum TaxID=34168 RepID=A0ACC2ASG2_DIPCM|nr:hypothetical protein O6H91_19G007900 [Diphasiastrum complanatum]